MTEKIKEDRHQIEQEKLQKFKQIHGIASPNLLRGGGKLTTNHSSKASFEGDDLGYNSVGSKAKTELKSFETVIRRIRKEKSVVKRKVMAEKKRKLLREKEEALLRQKQREEEEEARMQKHLKLEAEISKLSLCTSNFE